VGKLVSFANHPSSTDAATGATGATNTDDAVVTFASIDDGGDVVVDAFAAVTAVAATGTDASTVDDATSAIATTAATTATAEWLTKFKPLIRE
jgi:hypothetical protein